MRISRAKRGRVGGRVQPTWWQHEDGPPPPCRIPCSTTCTAKPAPPASSWPRCAAFPGQAMSTGFLRLYCQPAASGLLHGTRGEINRLVVRGTRAAHTGRALSVPAAGQIQDERLEGQQPAGRGRPSGLHRGGAGRRRGRDFAHRAAPQLHCAAARCTKPATSTS